MKSTRVLWLYSQQQYRNNTPINEIADHAQLNGFNDEPVDVLCLHGHEFIPAEDIARLARQNFHVKDVSALYAAVAKRYPNLRKVHQNHFFECFLRWIVVKEYYQATPLLAWDADIFFNEKLSVIHAAFAGSTLTCSSTCFVALHDPTWLQAYEQHLVAFERDPEAYLAEVFANLSTRHQSDPRQFEDCFFGKLTAAALASPEQWRKLFTSTPEEMFVDYLVRNQLLPHHLAQEKIDYLLCPQPLLLPLLAWSHPMGAGLPAACAGGGTGAGFELRDGRYCYNGHRLAFLHFQGAVFRSCVAYQILTRFLNEPTKIYDEFYCPPEQRQGRPITWFYQKTSGVKERLASLKNINELLARWGDPFSERSAARNFFIQSSLTEVFASYCLAPSSRLDQPAAMARSTIMVLTHAPKHPLFTSWLGQSRYPVVYETATGVDFEIPDHIGLIVSADGYLEPRTSVMCRAMERGIPTLLVADGILEYRNTFAHPQVAAGAVYQPAPAHKVACLGRSQARILESWGNTTQCEITGSARFDHFAKLTRRQRPALAPFRVLVMTALTPYFTPEQHAAVRQSLRDVKEFFARTPALKDVPLEVEWRLTKGLQQEIGVDTVVTDLSGRELTEVLQKVDAVISTPSTSMVEAMLLGLPVAVLDYCNCPHYVQPAWRITAAAHLLPTMTELVVPPAARILFQETTLHDTLECRTPAAPRLLQLASEMIVRGQQARATGQPLHFPARLLPVGGADLVAEEESFDLAALYPGQPQFGQNDVRQLQVEVGRLRLYAAQLAGGGVGAGELEKVKLHAQLTIKWRAKLEAGVALAALKQPKAAMDLMMQSIKSVESCGQPEVILEALLEISAELGRLDPQRAAMLLDIAHNLGTQMQRPAALQRAAQIRSRLPARAA